MRSNLTAGKLALWLSYVVAVILVILPFHAFITVWLSSGVGHYTLLRLWKEFLLVILAVGAAYLVITDTKLRQKLLSSRLFQFIAAYLLISIVWGLVAFWLDRVTLKALSFGLVVNLRYLVFLTAIWIIATKSQWLERVWLKLLFIPTVIVIVVGFLQRFVLPYDVLKHFGYGPNTIFPYQTINHDINYPRIMSTLRGANPLGTYLLLILSATAVLFLKIKKQRLLWGIFGLAGLAVIFFSHSRGAWIGLVISLLVLGVTAFGTNLKYRRLLIVTLIGLCLVTAGAIYGLRNNTSFENYLFHTNEKSKITESSNEEHVSAVREGFDQAVSQPLGRGVGTAGPASVYNNQPARIAENYYIQITQEVGWLGLAVFLAINIMVARELWLRRGHSLALALFISFVGIAAVNLVSHAWTDDTLAYIWWGVAGIAIASYKPITKIKP